MITYTWKIAALKVAENNLVVRVDLVVNGDNGKQTASVAITRDLARGDSFIPYKELTEQCVLDWCFAPEVISWIDNDNIEQTSTRLIKVEGEAQVASQIALQLIEKESAPALPWA
jgi:hypothetical protein